MCFGSKKKKERRDKARKQNEKINYVQIKVRETKHSTLGACAWRRQGSLRAVTLPETMPEGVLCSWQVQPSRTGGPWGRGQRKHAYRSSRLGRGFGSGLKTWNCKKKKEEKKKRLLRKQQRRHQQQLCAMAFQSLQGRV